jgi:phosphoenolpyruvate carboxykinase (ATP)
LGPLVVRTGNHTGRAPKDRFIVHEPSTQADICWGEINRPFDPAQFDRLLQKVLAYFQGADVFVQNCYAGADPDYRLNVRVITETAWHSLFARNMFIHPMSQHEEDDFAPEFTVIHAPGFRAVPEYDGTNSDSFVLINFVRKIVLIGGTSYAGEIKKSIFSVLNYLLPRQGVLSMHCSANMGDRNDVALFFGLSGTGKTTLASDSTRILIGDDEHGWSDSGIFNIEHGCYAKVIRLSPTGEPEIYDTTRRFGTILENVFMDVHDRQLDLDDSSFTENTRASYPIAHIPNATRDGLGRHPDNIIFLTADAFGVMPPVSKLTPEQAKYHFLSGYTAKVAGTEQGLSKEPQVTFSACFGAPFMPLHPGEYARLLGEKIQKHKPNIWLVNTGWTGGVYGEGERIKLAYTRAMIHAILDGRLEQVETWTEPYFGLHIPVECPGVPNDILKPRDTWSDPQAYDARAKELVRRFMANFAQYENEVDPAILSAQPVIG